ncbi:hypothetical protein CCMSSC00406_0004412 [Pleurotus cornucopiae]|uniref:Uncharacterized protein n=1 Tax=Pleurotus cornucopiae TaxID=5321 RepID=A0ACB7J095_PLECO|nr:hypothetical protein CCMSSC00406_0004412 [Pleurotus cornucopiae]
MRIAPAAPPILRLPQELLDDTLSRIDLHADLISFALASKACSRLVIPRHSQYRVIRVRHIYPHLWEHLACRADLAMGVRAVHICLRKDYTAPDHCPSTLLKGCASRQKDPDWGTVARNFGAALMHMRELHTFTWAWDHSAAAWTVADKLALEYWAFDALARLPNLKHLALYNFFILRLPTWVVEDRTYPLWNITNLTSLCLSGDTWTRPDHRPHLVSLLQKSPNLRHLDIPMEFQPLPSLHFPKLEELRLVLQSGSSYTIDESRARFIEQHPTITKLCWTPILCPPLSPNCLPNLRLLRSSDDDVIRTLNSGSCVRMLESLEVMVLTRELLDTMSKCFDRGSLKRIRILNFDDLATLRALAVTFPAITHLSVPPYFIPDIRRAVDLQLWMELLSLFTKLEVFRGLGIWQAANMNKARMHQAILNIVVLCPHLRELDHYQFNTKRLNNNRIIITREVTADEERIEYSIEKPDY